MLPDDLSADRRVVWQRFLTSYRKVIEHIERDLGSVGLVSLVEYEVLVRLVSSERNRLRFRDLATALLVTQSGVSKLVNRMAKDGFVLREATAFDNRATYAVLTDKGRKAYEQVQPVFIASFKRNFSDRLTDSDVNLLLTVFGKLMDLA